MSPLEVIDLVSDDEEIIPKPQKNSQQLHDDSKKTEDNRTSVKGAGTSFLNGSQSADAAIKINQVETCDSRRARAQSIGPPSTYTVHLPSKSGRLSAPDTNLIGSLDVALSAPPSSSEVSDGLRFGTSDFSHLLSTGYLTTGLTEDARRQEESSKSPNLAGYASRTSCAEPTKTSMPNLEPPPPSKKSPEVSSQAPNVTTAIEHPTTFAPSTKPNSVPRQQSIAPTPSQIKSTTSTASSCQTMHPANPTTPTEPTQVTTPAKRARPKRKSVDLIITGSSSRSNKRIRPTIPPPNPSPPLTPPPPTTTTLYSIPTYRPPSFPNPTPRSPTPLPLPTNLSPPSSSQPPLRTHWSCAQLATFAQELENGFDATLFASQHGKTRKQVMEAFSFLVYRPIFRWASEGRGRARARGFERSVRLDGREGVGRGKRGRGRGMGRGK